MLGMSKRRLSLFTVCVGLLTAVFPVAAVHAANATSERVIKGFYFTSLMSDANRFPNSALTTAVAGVRSYLAQDKPAFASYGYSDKRCSSSNYPNIPGACTMRADGTTWANWSLSLQRANTLRDEVTSRLTTAERNKVIPLWKARGWGEKYAVATIAQCQAAQDSWPCQGDRHADLVLQATQPPPPTTTTTSTTIPPPPPPPPTTPPTTPPQPPVANNDAFSFEYVSSGSYSNNVAGNDTCPAGSCSFSTASQPASGSVSVSPTGVFAFTAPQYFTGRASFTYRISSSNGLSSTASVSINVNPPSMPGAPVMNSTVATSSPRWARLSTNEKYVTSLALSCATGVKSQRRCTTDLGPVGAYTEISKVSVISVTLCAPPSSPARPDPINSDCKRSTYPVSRYRIPTLGDLSTTQLINTATGAFTPATGLLKFSQATPTSSNFTLHVTTETEYHEVSFRRDTSGAVTVVTDDTRVRVQSSNTTIGVVGSTR